MGSCLVWECHHRASQLPGDSLTQPAAGYTQTAASPYHGAGGGGWHQLSWTTGLPDDWTSTVIGDTSELAGEERGLVGFVLIPFVIVQLIMLGMAGCHHPTS